ncbi:MAG: hypothetical protein C0459_13980 [Chitinophaga sp.]|jgi:hypothetical protein|nr:hypothetical protein [Chitinophaga sp.]
MKALFVSISIICITVQLNAQQLQSTDFKLAEGKWKGSLTYLDYTSGKPYTMPADIVVFINPLNKNEVILQHIYPDEPKANGYDTLTINNNGTQLNSALVTGNTFIKTIKTIVTEEKAVDGNDRKPATIKHTYTISNDSFIIKKEVLFNETTNWLLRNTYSFLRN